MVRLGSPFPGSLPAPHGLHAWRDEALGQLVTSTHCIPRLVRATGVDPAELTSERGLPACVPALTLQGPAEGSHLAGHRWVRGSGKHQPQTGRRVASWMCSSPTLLSIPRAVPTLLDGGCPRGPMGLLGTCPGPPF